MEYSKMTTVISKELIACKKILSENNIEIYHTEIAALEKFIADLSKTEIVNQELIIKLIHNFQALIDKIDKDMTTISSKPFKSYINRVTKKTS